MPNFHPLPNRDAWPTIRGYVYQVDQSILRWLDLQQDEILELERGEDIDLVLPGLAESDEELRRRLEQVKHREGNLTLRSPEALAAVANYLAYRTTDSAARLHFCFTTNAQAGREKPSPMPGRRPALIVWNEIRDGSVVAAQRPRMISGLRPIVSTASAPDGITPERWAATADFFASATDAQLLDLIAGFEWSTGAGEAPELGGRIRERLLTDDSVSDEAAAQTVYERLFLYVFKALTQAGVKRLTRDALIAQLAQPALSGADAQLLASLKARVSEVERRVAAMEGTVAEHGTALARVSADLERLVRPDGPIGVVRYAIEAPVLDIPPLAERRSEREGTVEQLASIAAERTWLALHGSAGTGKTQLGILLARRLEVMTIWLTLHGADSDEAGLRVDAACAATANIDITSSRADWYLRVCETLGAGSLIVLDDVPRFVPVDGLGTRLAFLARACAQVGVHLLTTSVYAVPAGMRAVMSETILYDTQVPPFTNAEAAELLRAYGAPDRLLQAEPVAFLNRVAGQHPALLAAMARFLGVHDWQVSNEALEGLIKRKFASEVNEETMNHLLATVEDGDSRELLYRLTLIQHPFALEDVQALATVPEAVPRPRERLDALGGLWIQRDAGQRYAVSPLVATFGSSELTQATAQGCHRVLGERIVAQRAMTPPQIVEAMTHFHGASEYDRAGALLAWALSELNRRSVETLDFGLLSVWEDRPLPSGMSLGIRMYARALQVVGRIARGMPVDEMLSDLDALVAQATEGEAWALLGVVVATAGLLDVERALRYLRTAFQLVPTGHDPDGRPLVLSEDLRYEDLIWTAVPDIVTHDQLRDWLSLIEAMTSEQRARAFSDEQFAEYGSFALAEQVWLREVDKYVEERDWPAVLRLLEEFAQRTRALGAEILWACAVRAEIVVRAEYGGELTGAIDVAEAALMQASSDPRVQLLLRECAGRQYLYAGKADDAAEWLLAAVAYETDAFPHVRMVALLCLSRALLSGSDGAGAEQYARRAADLALVNDRISEMDVVRALGELAIVQWQAQGVDTAFAAWDEAGEQLFACRNENDLWQDLFVMYGHVSGYFTTLASTGQPPAVTGAGETYEPPRAGMLLEVRTDRATLYQANRDAFLAAQLAMFAEAVGRDDRAATWATNGLEWARNSHQWLALSQLDLNALPLLILDDRYGDVLETALESGALTVALDTLRKSGERTATQTGDYDELLESAFGPRPGPLWQNAEELALLLGVAPVAFRLATIALMDAERARACAADVAALCREIAATASNTRMWTMAADCLEQTFVMDVPASTLLDVAAQLDGDSASGLRVIARLGASLRIRGDPRLAFQIHQGLIPYIRGMLQNEPGIYRQVVMPFVVTFWNMRFAERRIHFRTPSLVETRLNDAQADQDGDIAQRVMDAIAPGLA